jgi:hypothetical protein
MRFTGGLELICIGANPGQQAQSSNKRWAPHNVNKECGTPLYFCNELGFLADCVVLESERNRSDGRCRGTYDLKDGVGIRAAGDVIGNPDVPGCIDRNALS